MNFFPETRQERQRRQLERRFDRWYAQPQPIRFYLWLLWLHLVPLLWAHFKITGWVRRRRIKIGGFVEYTLPVIRAPLPMMDIADLLVSVQPMTRTAAQTFYINYQMGPSAPAPRTRKASGWLWGIIVWGKI